MTAFDVNILVKITRSCSTNRCPCCNFLVWRTRGCNCGSLHQNISAVMSSL